MVKRGVMVYKGGYSTPFRARTRCFLHPFVICSVCSQMLVRVMGFSFNYMINISLKEALASSPIK